MSTLDPPPKRRKTAHACDHCRSHKLKCLFAYDGEGNANICKHCKDFGIACHVTVRPKLSRRRQSRVTISGSSSTAPNSNSADTQRWRRRQNVALTEPRYSGPTSLSQLVSAVTRKWPSRADHVLGKMDSKYGHTRVEGVSGGPFLLLPQVRYPPEHVQSREMDEARLSLETKRSLLLKYQRFIAPVFAILSNEESEEAVDLEVEDQPIATLSNLGLALLSVAAMTRSTSMETRMALLYHLRGRPQVDIGSSLATLQYLLLLSANVELLSPDNNVSTGMSLNLTGLVTRMAQDLGLHRDISQLDIPQKHLKRRARIWAACIVQDRWYSLSYGQPCLIRLEDCDAPGPSAYNDEVHDASFPQSREKPYEVHVEHEKLSILMSRLLSLVFTPSGLKRTPIKELEALKEDLDHWSDHLPTILRLTSQSMEEVPIGAGFLHLLKVSVDFIFYRGALLSPFNKSTKPSMSPSLVWDGLVKRSAEAIDWVASRDGTSVLDAWSVSMYALIQCILVQFYAAVNGRDPRPLRKARQVMQSWSSSIEIQSHGYYDPQEGNAPLASSTTTAAQPSSASDRGKKSLTLRTKAYTLIAMLAGIAEHHIANRASQTPQLAGTGSMTTAASVEKANMTGSVGKETPVKETSPRTSDPRKGKGAGADLMTAGSYVSHFGERGSAAHLFTDSPSTLYAGGSGSVQPPPYAAHPLPSASVPSWGEDSYENSVEQIDLVTLQRWADELLRTPSNFDASFPSAPPLAPMSQHVPLAPLLHHQQQPQSQPVHHHQQQQQEQQQQLPPPQHLVSPSTQHHYQHYSYHAQNHPPPASQQPRPFL